MSDKTEDLRFSLLEVTDEKSLDKLPCGTIIYAQTASWPGRVALFKNPQGDWKMFDVKGIQVEEREGDFTPTLPVLLVLFGDTP